MIDVSETLELVQTAVRDHNEMNDTEIAIDPETKLFGTGSELDSIGLVKLIVTVEEMIADRFGRALTLADDRALSRSSSPFRTIGTLSDHIAERLDEADS